MFFSISLFLSLSFSFVPLPQCSILSLYSPPPPHPHHPFLPNPLPFPTLASEEGHGRNLLSCGLYCSSHFLINAADKAIVFQLMRMQQAIPGLKHPYYPLSSTLLILTSFWMPRSTTIRFLPSSGDFFPWAGGLQHLDVITVTLQLPLRSSGQHCDPSASSSVFGYPQWVLEIL